MDHLFLVRLSHSKWHHTGKDAAKNNVQLIFECTQLTEARVLINSTVEGIV